MFDLGIIFNRESPVGDHGFGSFGEHCLIEGECITLGVLLRLRHWSEFDRSFLPSIILPTILPRSEGVLGGLNMSSGEEF